MWTWRTFVRSALGVFVMLHALAHAVLPLRGVLEYPPQDLASALTIVAYSLSLVTLFAAGVGILGSRLFERHVARLMGIGLVSSVVALTAGWDPAVWWGLALDAGLAGAFAAARNSRVLRAEEQRSAPPTRSRAGRWLGEAVACGLVGYVAIGTVLWPWHRRWGTTPADRVLAVPGDPVSRNPNYELTHAVTIDAPPDVVWAWLVQLGQDRAGFYSYDWLERLFRADVHNVYEIRPEWQHRAAGDFVRATPPGYLAGLFGQDVGWRITHLEPGRAMVLEHWGAFVLEPVGSRKTRFIIRSSIGGRDMPAWGAALTFALFELPHFLMERKMMLTIKARAERQAVVARLER
jgi:uncharacterized protein YndB with AHSA1/START domain